MGQILRGTPRSPARPGPSARPGELLLDVYGLSKRFGALAALEDVSFGVRPGEVLGLIGPNGAGKTTLFECLAGVLPADAGRVGWGGRTLEPSARKQALFFVPDGIVPWADQSVGSVLSFFAGIFGAQRGRPGELAAALCLECHLPARVASLSKGERKRLLVALGLLVPRPLLLLDEPFDGLDLRQSREAEGVLRSSAVRGKTLFLSIHQLSDAARVCDRLVLLSGGRVAGEGTLPELRRRAGVPPEGGLEEVFLALTS